MGWDFEIVFNFSKFEPKTDSLGLADHPLYKDVDTKLKSYGSESVEDYFNLDKYRLIGKVQYERYKEAKPYNPYGYYSLEYNKVVSIINLNCDFKNNCFDAYKLFLKNYIEQEIKK